MDHVILWVFLANLIANLLFTFIQFGLKNFPRFIGYPHRLGNYCVEYGGSMAEVANSCAGAGPISCMGLGCLGAPVFHYLDEPLTYLSMGSEWLSNWME